MIPDEELRDEAPAEEVSETPASTETEEAPKELSETERIAQEMGWSPKDKWRGPEEQWRPAVDFLRKGVEINRDLKTRVDRQERAFTERVQRSERMAEVALERQRRQLDDHYKSQMRYAASQGDMDVYSAVETRRDQALEHFDKEVAPARELPQQQPDTDPAVAAFVERHRGWFRVDPVMTGAAEALCGELQTRYPSLPVASIMNMVDESMRNEFPHKFGQRQTTESKGPARVEGGLKPIKTSTKKGWDQLPQEAKKAGSKYIGQGLFGSDDAKARATYAEQYWNQE